MSLKSRGRKTTICGFISNLRDDRKDVEKCVDFINDLQLVSTISPPPLVEVFTVIKEEKPVLYSFLKPRLMGKRNYSLLLDLSVDYDVAKNRLMEV